MTTDCIFQNNSYTIYTPKPNKITAHLSEILTYLHRFASVHSES